MKYFVAALWLVGAMTGQLANISASSEESAGALREALKLDGNKMGSSGKLDGSIEESMRLEFLAKIEIEKDHLRGNNLSIDEAKQVFETMAKLRHEYQMVEEFPEPPTAAERLDSLIEGFKGKKLAKFNECVVYHEEAAEKSSNIKKIIDYMGEGCNLRMEGRRINHEAYCSQGREHLKLLAEMLPTDITSSGKRLCAVILDEVLPFEEEPACMQVINLITTSFIRMAGSTVPWPEIVTMPKFPAAFREACNILGKNSDSCKEQLAEVQELSTDNKADEFFAEFCEAVGAPLTFSDAHIRVHKDTSRGRFLSVLKQSAQHVEKRSRIGPNSDKEWVRSASGTTVGEDCCEHSDCGEMETCVDGVRDCFSCCGLYSSCSCPGMYADGTCEMESEHVCETEKARTIEQTISGGWGVEIGYTSTEAYGWMDTTDDICTFASATFESICASAALDDPTDFLPTISYGVVFGEYNEFSNIAGPSVAKGVQGCFVFCVEGGVIYDLSFTQIGTYWGTGVALDFGLDFETAYCYTHGPTDVDKRGVTTHQVDVSEASEDCFSSHMTVKLETGDEVFMKELKVGDMVQTMQDNGDFTFEPFLGFLHLHHTKSAEFLQVIHGGAAKHVLEVTKHHLVYVKTVDGFRTIAAGDLEPGMMLIMKNDADGNNVESRIDDIGTVMRAGIYAPLTYSSKMMVENVLISSYAVLPGVQMGDWYMAGADVFTFPIRTTRWAMISCGFTWEDPEKEVVTIVKLWRFLSKTLPKSISSLSEAAVCMLQHASNL